MNKLTRYRSISLVAAGAFYAPPRLVGSVPQLRDDALQP